MTSSFRFRLSVLAVAFTALLAACSQNNTSVDPGPAVVNKDLVIGTGDTLAVGDTAWLHYTLTLENGTFIQSTYEDGIVFFCVNDPQATTGSLITGFYEAITGMRVGGRRQSLIPWQKGYGSRGNSTIPGYANLVYDLRLVKVKKKKTS